MTLAIKIDPALWERPEFGANPQNPLFAGLADSVKGIREFGVSLLSWRNRSGWKFAFTARTPSPLGLWTVAQGGLGMARCHGSKRFETPAILGRIKTQAVEKNVFVRVEMLMEDFEEFSSSFMPPVQSKGKAGKDPMVGKKAMPIQTKMLNGEDFNLADHKGKVVVLDFWASWCGPCVQALPNF